MVPLATRTVIGCTGDSPTLFSAGSELTVATVETNVGVAVVVGTLGALFEGLGAGVVMLGAEVWVPAVWEDVDGPVPEAVPADVEDESAPAPTVIRLPVAGPGPVA